VEARAAGLPEGWHEGVDNKKRRGIAYLGIGYYLALQLILYRVYFP